MPTVAQTTPSVKMREFKAAVLAAMTRRGWRQRELCRAIGKGRTAISLAINAGKYPAVKRAIALELNLPKLNQ